jgi:hypothetical protein
MPPSTMAIQGQRASSALESAANDLADQIGPTLDILFETLLLPGQTMPLTETERIQLIGRWLARDRQQLIASDRLNGRQLRIRKKMLAKRDAQAAMLHDRVIDVRRYFDGTHGPGEAAAVLGLEAGIPEDPTYLQRYVRDAVEQISEPGFVLPEPKFGAAVEVEQILNDLVPLLEPLEETLDRINPEKRSTQVSLKGKRTAQESFEYSLGRCARYLEALFYLAGEDFFAERVRQSSHIPSSTEEEEVVAEGEGPTDGEANPAEPVPEDAETVGAQEAPDVTA